jgi:transcriptional regulator of acetoin/glycerol metabolism
MEAKAIEAVLKNNFYNLSETAKELGIGRATLYRKMKQYGISGKRPGT